jgi:rhodanese-related sulfurtransferase
VAVLEVGSTVEWARLFSPSLKPRILDTSVLKIKPIDKEYPHMEQQPVHPLEITCAAVKAKLDGGEDFLLLDCREADEHQLVNIPQAQLLPMSEISQRQTELEPHRAQPIIVHCHHGMRSLQVTEWLQQQGYDDVKSMAGGIDAWAVEIDSTLSRY